MWIDSVTRVILVIRVITEVSEVKCDTCAMCGDSVWVLCFKLTHSKHILPRLLTHTHTHTHTHTYQCDVAHTSEVSDILVEHHGLITLTHDNLRYYTRGGLLQLSFGYVLLLSLFWCLSRGV
jgi:hypothetical protein